MNELLSLPERKRKMRRNGWILLALVLAVPTISHLLNIQSAALDTITFLCLCAAVVCFVAAAIAKAPAPPAKDSSVTTLTPPSTRRDESRWYHAAAAIVFPYVALPWGIVNLVRGRYRSGWMLVIVSCISLPFIMTVIWLQVDTRSYSWQWLASEDASNQQEHGVKGHAKQPSMTRLATKEDQSGSQASLAERFTLHTDATNGFTLLYPKDWEKVSPDFLANLRQRGASLDDLRLGVVSPDGALVIQVLKKNLEKPMTVREYVDALRTEMKEVPTRPKVIAEEETEVSGLKAVKQRIDSITPTSGSPMRNVVLRVVRGSIGWSVIFAGAPNCMDESRSMADKVLASFEFIGKKSHVSESDKTQGVK